MKDFVVFVQNGMNSFPGGLTIYLSPFSGVRLIEFNDGNWVRRHGESPSIDMKFSGYLISHRARRVHREKLTDIVKQCKYCLAL
jgi:hypothetical protein